MNCLNQAIAEERIHQVRLLLSLGVDPEFRDRKDLSRTPLIKASRLACEESAFKIVKILLKSGVNINSIDDNFSSPLHYAAERGSNSVVETLLKEGSVELNKQDIDGRTPLMLCAMNGHQRTARTLALRLTKFDLDIDLRDNEGFTALLFAIKSQNYDIAHDLIRYGNACTTIRDNKEHRNAGDWLKKTLLKNQKGFAARKRSEQPGQVETKEDSRLTGPGKHGEAGPNEAIPLVTLQNSPDSDNEFSDQGSKTLLTEVGSKIKQVAALSGLLFEPDPYGRHSRPPSSILSKASYASSKKPQQRMPSPVYSESTLLTGQLPDEQSNVSYAPSELTLNQAADGEVLAERQVSSSTRKSSKMGLRLSMAANSKLLSSSKMRREAIANSSVNLPMSFDRPPIKNNFLLLVKVPARDQSKNNKQSIEKLKQAIDDQRKRRITRPSTRLTRPYTAVPYEALAENQDPQLPARPHTRAQLSGTSRMSIAKTRPAPHVKAEDEIVQPTEKLTPAQSHLSLDTLFTSSDVSDVSASNAYQQASAIESAQKNIRALFSLYSDSYLWFPPKGKSVSLSVQAHEAPSDKLTLTSERTTSVSDLASINDRASVDNLHQKPSLEGKSTNQRNRVTSSSATSRASRRSLGGKSANSGSFVR